MIKATFLKMQTSKSMTTKRTSPFLRRLTASVVDREARRTFGRDYPTKCLQTSYVLGKVLARLGISSRIWMGAFCSADIFAQFGHDSWGGFWGDDHHVWLVTQFGELVDLSIAEACRHPGSRRSDGIPMPALWWDDVGKPLSVIRYLPDSIVDRIAFPDEADQRQLEAFEASALTSLDDMTANASVASVSFAPLLDGTRTANELHAAGNLWLNRAIAFQDRGIPFPAWIQNRIGEMTEAHRTGAVTPSRLSKNVSLVAQRI